MKIKEEEVDIIRDKINRIQDVEVRERYEENLKKFEERIKLLGVGSNNLILFLGAGVSCNYGIKMWKKLAEELVKKIEETKLKTFLESKDLKYKIQIAFSELSARESLLEVLKELVLYEREREILDNKDLNGNHIIQSLNKFKNNDNVKYITTNIDRLLEIYLNERTALFPESNSTDKIIKLHGCINDIESLVFTPKQYAKMYSELDKDKIEDIFSKATVLFVGKSLEDEIIQMLFKSEKLNDIYLLKHYDENSDSELELKCDLAYYKDININVLPYTDYLILPELLDKVYYKIGVYKSVQDISKLRIDHFLEKSELANSINLLLEEVKRIGVDKFRNNHSNILKDIKFNEKKIWRNLWSGSIEKYFELKKINDGNLEDVWGKI